MNEFMRDSLFMSVVISLAAYEAGLWIRKKSNLVILNPLLTAILMIIGLLLFLLFIFIYLVIIVGIIFIDKAERRLPIQYSNRTTGAYGGEQTYIPIRLNSAGVIPNVVHILLILSVLGLDSPISHFDTICLDTPILFPNSSCDNPSNFRIL